MSKLHYRCEAAAATVMRAASASGSRHPLLYYRCSKAASCVRSHTAGPRQVCESHLTAKRVTWCDEIPVRLRTQAPQCEALPEGVRCAGSATVAIADGGPPQLVCRDHQSRSLEFVPNTPDLDALSQELLSQLRSAEYRHQEHLDWIMATRPRDLEQAARRCSQRLRMIERSIWRNDVADYAIATRDDLEPSLAPQIPGTYELQLSQQLPLNIPSPEALRALVYRLAHQRGQERAGDVLGAVAAMAGEYGDTDDPLAAQAADWLLGYLKELWIQLEEFYAILPTDESEESIQDLKLQD